AREGEAARGVALRLRDDLAGAVLKFEPGPAKRSAERVGHCPTNGFPSHLRRLCTLGRRHKCPSQQSCQPEHKDWERTHRTLLQCGRSRRRSFARAALRVVKNPRASTIQPFE